MFPPSMTKAFRGAIAKQGIDAKYFTIIFAFLLIAAIFFAFIQKTSSISDQQTIDRL